MSAEPAIIDAETGEVIEMSHYQNVASFDEWVRLGKVLVTANKRLNWHLGDWWASGKQAYGERAKVAAQNIFGLEFQTLMNLASVAKSFETSRRREVLSFSHHAEVAALPPSQADALLDEAEVEGWTRKEMRLAVNRIKNEARLPAAAPVAGRKVFDFDALVRNGEKFGCIYADPPWLYDNQGTRASTGNHYGGMTVDELCALPVREIAADDAHLHLWTTNGFLFECPRIFAAWGFEFRSSFVWVKSQMGIGNYWRNSHEFLLTAIRGDAKRFSDKSLKSWLECDRGVHSAKPEQVRHFIEKASPGPYLEMFARSGSPNWTVWGNQIPGNLLDHDMAEVA
jgi:N6-adenosine-specific RNA methylase IME4